MIKLKILTLLCSFILCINLFADDDHYKKSHYNQSKHNLYKNLDYLDLDKKQYKNLKDILLEYKKEYKKFYKFKSKKDKELAKLLKYDNFNEEKYKEIFNQIQSKNLELELNNFKSIHNILNKRQRKKFSHYMQEWRVD